MDTLDQAAPAAKPNPKRHDIVVNGKPRQVEGPLITYDEAVRLAYPEGPFDIIYTVAYTNPNGHDGTLAPGQKTPVHDGMEFRVRRTNRS
ncbi:multiubiquitin domain-containing protein [Paucibacter sp. M5-1]|uniref:multiubiquitin domain-containing protein n=1 Tax=Paucibacter sp. M5-1 TaxID=3015998 RepID=UPI0022B8FA9A|nr:multiubiquitin domain-containing protein [Paucibacter sp. M5-1]MCZ7881922.1 multiubiquitin domain-containing protein [Paucibacter sp. M5-1]